MEPKKAKFLHAKTLSVSEQLYYHRVKPKKLKKASTIAEVKNPDNLPIGIPTENITDPAIIQYLTLFKDYLIQVNKSLKNITDAVNAKHKIKVNYTRNLIIFDLDETLVHTDSGELKSTLRPYVHEMLEALSPYYELAVWTASEKHYADQVISGLVDPLGKYFKLVLYRDDCVQLSDELFLKDFRIFEGLDMKKAILIDNQLISFATNLENGFLCDSFLGSMEDTELVAIRDFFFKSKDEPDLQKLLCTTFHLKETIDEIMK